MRIQKGGKFVPQKSLFDINIKWVNMERRPELARYWITKIPSILWIDHEDGDVRRICASDVGRANIMAWERDNEYYIRQFATLIRRIIEVARSRATGKCEVRLEEPGVVLRLLEQKGNEEAMLTDELKAIWEAGGPNHYSPVS